jgi:hypothetical protein
VAPRSCGARPTLVPQRLQNLAVSANSRPHIGHAIMRKKLRKAVKITQSYSSPSETKPCAKQPAGPASRRPKILSNFASKG